MAVKILDYCNDSDFHYKVIKMNYHYKCSLMLNSFISDCSFVNLTNGSRYK